MSNGRGELFTSEKWWHVDCTGCAVWLKTFCWLQVVSTLVSEIILCVKEVNRRTRVAAFELLIGLAHAMDTTYPPPLPSIDAHMGEQSTSHLHGKADVGLSALLDVAHRMFSSSCLDTSACDVICMPTLAAWRMRKCAGGRGVPRLSVFGLVTVKTCTTATGLRRVQQASLVGPDLGHLP